MGPSFTVDHDQERVSPPIEKWPRHVSRPGNDRGAIVTTSAAAITSRRFALTMLSRGTGSLALPTTCFFRNMQLQRKLELEEELHSCAVN